jgi:LysM repeat protein
MKIRSMYSFTLTILLTLGLIFLMPPSEAFSQSNSDTHTVQSGDTLFSISRQYDVTVAELREWNDLENDGLRIGMELRVTPPEQTDAITHTVAPQETLFAISRKYGVSIAEIQQWNDLETTALSVGQELIIYSESGGQTADLPVTGRSPEAADPTPLESIVTPTLSASTYYTVQSGDYLNRIASEHGMTTQELRQLNNLENDMIRVGQRLVVRETQSTPVVDEDFEESTPQGRFVIYRLESGDDTDSILERFSMTREELEALNPGSDIESLRSGQRITVLLPTSRTFENPYRHRAGLRDLGDVSVSRYDDTDFASSTTSGELYNPDHLTAAHSNMALGSIVYIENPENGRGVYVRINDRFSGNGIKLSKRAFEALKFASESQASATIYQEE